MRTESLASLRATWRGYERTDDVDAFVKRALAELRPAALILFGSLAKGDYHQSSDADLCVVLPQPEADLRRDGLRVSELDATGGVEAVVFGRDQFLRMVGQGNGLALEILHWGVVLGGDPLFLATLANAWREAWTTLGLEKTATGWRIGRPAGSAGA